MKIAFIGCGNMGEAILGGIYKAHDIYVCEPRLERQTYLKKKYRVKIGPTHEVVDVADVVIIAIKPQDIPELLAELKTYQTKGKVFVSIAAGITTKFIQKVLGGSTRVVRVMPNMPAFIGEGVTALTAGKSATAKDMKTSKAIFASVGEVIELKESRMDAVTAVSGSGPAYVFLFAECMLKAARKLGFKEDEAKLLVHQTLEGSMKMLLASPDGAADLRKKVTSKGGTTQAALEVFFERDIEDTFVSALKAARDRAKELSL
jgi:pyrroline-5-carboxylate reductase